ncbi:MAG: hypothetical protein ACI3YK_00640 [Eubacteriales bacterium]
MTDPQNFSGMGDLLKKVMENPELLSGAMNMASVLASSGALNNLFPKKTDEMSQRQEPIRDWQGDPEPHGTRQIPCDRLPPSEDREECKKECPPKPPHRQKIGHKERIALLEAMRPFISPDKKDRLELLIRLLEVMELAEGMGGKSTR